MESLKKSFGRRVRAIREAHNHSREFLSQNVEIDPQSIYRLERGEQWIAPEKLELLAQFYKVPVASFFTDEVVKIHPTPEEALEVLAKAISHIDRGPSLRKVPSDILEGLAHADETDLESIRDVLTAAHNHAEKKNPRRKRDTG